VLYRAYCSDERHSNRENPGSPASALFACWDGNPPRPSGLRQKWGHTSLSSLHGDLPHAADSASSGPIFARNAVRPIS
jgi:hypothetical protein